jgi:hypothetical protein
MFAVLLKFQSLILNNLLPFVWPKSDLMFRTKLFIPRGTYSIECKMTVNWVLGSMCKETVVAYFEDTTSNVDWRDSCKQGIILWSPGYVPRIETHTCSENRLTESTFAAF